MNSVLPCKIQHCNNNWLQTWAQLLPELMQFHINWFPSLSVSYVHLPANKYINGEWHLHFRPFQCMFSIWLGIGQWISALQIFNFEMCSYSNVQHIISFDLIIIIFVSLFLTLVFQFWFLFIERISDWDRPIQYLE